MEELLLSKGFELQSFSDGNFYVLKFEVAEDDEMYRLLKIFEMDNDEYFDVAILQCNENFGQCSIMVDCNVYELTLEEFEEIVCKL